MQNKLDQIQKLKENYRDSFFDKKSQIDEFIELIMGGQHKLENTDEVIFDGVHEYMHKLAGSSGMYEYPDIAELACLVMSLTNKHHGKPVKNKITALLQQLSNLLEQYIKG